MKLAMSAAAFALFCSFSPMGQAQAINLPLQLDYALLNKVVADNLYVGGDHTVDLWQDRQKCSSLKLANLKIDGKDRHIRLLNDVRVQLGAKLGDQCLPILQWQGVLETLQQPVLNADHTVLALPITQATAYDQQGRQVKIDKLDDLLKGVVEPKLAGLSIDLNRVHKDMAHNFQAWLPKHEAAQLNSWLDTLRFNGAAVNDQGIAVELGLDAPAKGRPQPSSPALTAAELQQWQPIWQQWEGLLDKAIKGLGNDAQSQALRASLNAMLQDSHKAFQEGLAAQNSGGEDPVRSFFSQSWDTLTPQLKQLAGHVPELDGFNFLGAISAADALYALDNQASPLGISLSSDGLRKLVRLLIAGRQEHQHAGQ